MERCIRALEARLATRMRWLFCLSGRLRLVLAGVPGARYNAGSLVPPIPCARAV